MKTATLKPLLGESPHLSAIWSLPEITGIELPTAKLGGTGLALSVLVDIETIEPGFTPVEQLRAMGAFLRHMQKQDGDFYFRFIPSKGGRQATPRSRFYAGEAALGLISLYERDPDPRWLAAGVKALMFLVRAQKGEAAELNAWALIAMERLFLMDHLPETLYPRTQFSAYVQRQVKLIASRCLRTSTSGITGCFNEWGAVADTASHLEALLAAFTILKMGKKQERELRYLLALGVGFLLRAQIKKGPYAGGFPKAIGAVARNAAHDEEFVRTAGEIRIDYVQHSLSALSQYYVLLEEE